MNSNKKSGITSTDINRQMMELKKKIQLCEGQRKAAFEDCEAERKSNFEEIQKLKKSIGDIQRQLNEATNPTTSIQRHKKEITALIGPFEHKTIDEIKHLIDLQIIDKTKALNLLIYKFKQRRQHLTYLGKEYQVLFSEKGNKQVVEKIDKPAQKATSDLQNKIHAVEVQLREANHISIRYKEIKKSLQDDAARFESNIQAIEDEITAQRNDIERLQAVLVEATRIRGISRSNVLKEEKLAMAAANMHEKQTAEGKRLMNCRKQELEMLEKRIFTTGKVQARNENDMVEDGGENIDEESEITPTQAPNDVLADAFNVLKKATGATTAGEVLERFNSQKDTFNRLMVLRKKSEIEKRKLEKQLDNLNAKLEEYKFAEVKETERKSLKMEKIEKLINEQKVRSELAKQTTENKQNIMIQVLKKLRELHLGINPLARPKNNLKETIKEIREDFKIIFGKMSIPELTPNIEKTEIAAVTSEDVQEEKWLPAPYSGLVSRTPIPQPGASPAPLPPVSDEEEEVPSRTYLKRQAQLVVDAKSRRKNIRLRN